MTQGGRPNPLECLCSKAGNSAGCVTGRSFPADQHLRDGHAAPRRRCPRGILLKFQPPKLIDGASVPVLARGYREMHDTPF